MTSIDVSQLIRDRDVAALSALLDHHDASLDELDAMIRTDRALRHLALLHIERRLDAPVGRATREGLARLLPVMLDDGPELALVLAGLYRRLAPWRTRPLPAWRTAGLPVAIELAWLRTELASAPETVAREPFGERLLQALAPETLTEVRDPLALIRALAGRAEQPLQRLAIEQLRHALHRSRVLPADARALLLELAVTDHDDIACEVVRELSEPWSLLLPPPGETLTALLARPGVLGAALACAARWRLEGPIRGAMESAEVEPRLRQRAMELAGTFARRGDVSVVISIAASDPLLFGPPLLSFLRAQHRLGHFVGDDDAARLADVCLANEALDAGEVADLVFPARHAFVAALVAAGPDAPSWVRRAPLLVAVSRGPQGATPVEVGPVIEATLRATGDPRVRRALIHALGELRYMEGEAAVLAQLETEPQAALGALRAIGGRDSIAALLAGLDRVRLRPFRDAALTLAWQLSELEPAQRSTLRGSLVPGDVPPGIAASLATRGSAEELALLHGALRNATASHYLQRLAAVAGATEWSLLGDLVLRVVSGIAAPEVEAPMTRDHFEVPRGEAAQILSSGDREALEAMGRRLFRAACIRPLALLDAADERTAGPLLVSALARELLTRPDLTEAETVVLLRTLDPGVDRRVFPAIHRMLRRPEPAIRKTIIALLVRDGADELLANLTRLTEEDDIETVRQAILAIGALGERGGASVAALTRCLDHRNMNIKKSAAQALATAGGPAAVTKLVFWLGYHDNPGFREAIIAALRAILGPAYAATIVASLAQPDPDHSSGDAARREDLLIAALDGALASEDALALCRSAQPFAARLRGAIERSELALASGDRTVFAGEAEPEMRSAIEPARSSLAEHVRALAADGYRRPLARAVLGAARAPDASWAGLELSAVRRFWFEWCAWLDADDASADERAAAVELLARLAELARPTREEWSALGGRYPVLLAMLTAELDDAHHAAALGLLAGVVPVLPAPTRLAIAAELRALPGRPNLSGRDPFALLRSCGAVITRGDLDRALRDARRTADPGAIERRILGQLFDAGAASLPAAELAVLEQAARRADGRDLAVLRAQPPRAASAQLGALLAVYPVAHEANRRAVVDWMEALQPLGAPRWTLAEHAAGDAQRTRRASERRPHATDLDQPRSLALGDRLTAMLDAPNPEQRRTAKAALLTWPEPAFRAAVGDAYLRGTIDLAGPAALACAIAELGDERLLDALEDADARPRLLRLLPHAPDAVAALTGRLLELHDEACDADDGATRDLVIEALRALPGDALLVALTPRFAAGDFRLADAVTRKVRSSPELDVAIELAHREGRDWLVERWRELELRPHSAQSEHASRQAFARGLAEQRARSPAAVVGPPAPTRESLLRDATTGSLESARRALTVLARDPDLALVAMLHDRLGHAHPRMRLHAHRLLRGCETRDAYLEATMRLLGDPIDEVRRTAVRTLGFGRFAPAVPALVELLADRSPVVRKAAEQALVHIGEPSRGALRHTAAGARPDRRAIYQHVLDQLDRAAQDTDA